MKVTEVEVKNVLTRTSGYLDSIASHSLQPYRGCSFGNSLCGVGCYVQHNPFITRGRAWGSFLEARTNAASSYLRTVARERRYCQRKEVPFAIFMSSSTDPFLPQESRYRISEAILAAMVEQPPEVLILQTHSAAVAQHISILERLHQKCRLRVHLSIETDRERLPGLPAPASSVESRILAAGALQAAGLRVVITVAPLLPVEDLESFFQRLSQVSDAVVLDHFVGGDGSESGQRTRKTPLPKAMEVLLPDSSKLGYLETVLRAAKSHYQGEIGIGRDGFAGRYLR
jgi:DNA repair photolyase